MTGSCIGGARGRGSSGGGSGGGGGGGCILAHQNYGMAETRMEAEAAAEAVDLWCSLGQLRGTRGSGFWQGRFWPGKAGGRSGRGGSVPRLR